MVQWPFATFLMSPAARNYFFGAIYFDYYTSPAVALLALHLHCRYPSGAAAFASGALTVTVIAVVGSWLGIGWGNWMRRIHR